MCQEFKSLNDIAEEYHFKFDNTDLEYTEQIVIIYNSFNP